MKLGPRILVIPDCQVKPGVSTDHLEHVGRYILDKRPEYIVCLGDFADMPSLSTHDEPGSLESEGKRYSDDIESAVVAMKRLVMPFYVKAYHPKMHLTIGNHEDRITRARNADPRRFTGRLSDLSYNLHWQVHSFLSVVKIHGIEFSHYFVSGSMGRPVSSASGLLRVRQSSAVMGHVQQTDVAFHPRTGNIGLFAGTCYTHDEDYLGRQANNQRRQVVMLNEVRNGTFDPMFVSLKYLEKRYG